MSDRDVEREIEENERRARDKQDVGLDEDVMRENDDGGGLLDRALDSIPGLGDTDSEKRQVEHDDNTRDRSLPE